MYLPQLTNWTWLSHTELWYWLNNRSSIIWLIYMKKKILFCFYILYGFSYFLLCFHKASRKKVMQKNNIYFQYSGSWIWESYQITSAYSSIFYSEHSILLEYFQPIFFSLLDFPSTTILLCERYRVYENSFMRKLQMAQLLVWDWQNCLDIFMLMFIIHNFFYLDNYMNLKGNAKCTRDN